MNTPPTYRYEMENGLVFLLKPISGSGLVAVEATLGTGSITEGEWLGSGISHFVEHMLFKGTERRKVGEVEREVQQFGGTYDAFTSYEYTGYRIVAPQEHLYSILDLLSDVLQNATFDSQELEKEREVILKELALNRDDPERFLHLLGWERAYSVHPYRHPIIGYESLFRSLTRDDLLRYYRQRYVPNHLILGIAGDFSIEDAKSWIKEKFSNMQRKTLAAIQIPHEPLQMSPRVTIVESDKVELAHLLLTYHTVSLRDPDLYALDVLAIVLGEGESSYLHRLLHRLKRLVYEVSCSSYTPRDPGVFTIHCLLEPGKIDQTVGEIQRELDHLSESGFAKNDLEKAKRSVIANYLANHQTVQSIVSDISHNELLTSDPDFSERYVAGIQEVTSQDLGQMIKKYLRKDQLTQVALVAPSQKTTQKTTEINGSLKGKKGLTPFTEGMKKNQYANGAVLLTKQDYRVPIVSLVVALQGGLRSETSARAGLSNFTAQLVIKGTSKRSAEEISSWVEEHGGALAPFSGNNSFGFSLQLMKEDLQEGFLLLFDLIRNPIFPEDEIERIRSLIQANIKMQEEDPFQKSAKLLKENLFQLHPFRWTSLGTSQAIQEITRSDLLNYHRHFCLPSNLVISVVGDFDPRQVESLVKPQLESWKPKTEKVIFPAVMELPLQQPKMIRQLSVKDQAMVLMGFHTVDLFSKERYLFELLAAILSGGSGTLYDAIRQKEGLAYSVGAYGVSGIDIGYFVFYVATAPESVERVQELLQDQIELLRNKAIDPSSLQRAKQELIGNNRIGLQTYSSLAFKTALDECYGLGYPWIDQYEEKIQQVTVEDLQRAAQLYFASEKSVTVILTKE